MSVAATEEATIFAQRLKQFCREDHAAPANGNPNFFTRNPGKFVHGPVVALNVTSKALGAEGVSMLAANVLVNAALVMLGKRVDNVTEQGIVSFLKTALSYTSGVIEKHTASQVAKHSIGEVRRTLKTTGSSITTHNEQLKSQLDFLNEDRPLGAAEIMAVAQLLMIVIHHTSDKVGKVVQKLPDAAFAKLTGQTIGSVTSVSVGLGMIAAAPLIAPIGAIAFGAYLVCAAGIGIANSIAIEQNVIAGTAWTDTKSRCTQLKFNMKEMDDSMRAFCGYLGFLYFKKMELDHLNDEEYIKMVRELDKRLPRSVEDWSDPDYISNYCKIVKERIEGVMSNVVSGLEDLGVLN